MRKIPSSIIKTVLSFFLKSSTELPYVSRWAILLTDLTISAFAFTLSYVACGSHYDSMIFNEGLFYKLLLNTIVSLFFFVLFRTYAGVVRYSTFIDGWRVFEASFLTGFFMLLIHLTLTYHVDLPIMPGIGFLINFILMFSLMFSLRMFVKLMYDYVKKENLPHKTKPLVLIYNVSSSTLAIAQMMMNNSQAPYQLCGFISPDTHNRRNKVLGLPVYTDNALIRKEIVVDGISAIMVNPVELDRRVKQNLMDFCLDHNIQMISPEILEWADCSLQLNKIKGIQIEDLLGRPPIQINIEEIAQRLDGKCIMITGAAGSIGSELVRQIAHFNIRQLILCDIAETPLYNLQREVQEKYPGLTFVHIICDVRNYHKMEMIFDKYRPQAIYHAAAYKHVPLMEEYPVEAVRVNVFGTKNMADLALKYGTEIFVMISTDKAVNPSNVMGASKRAAEIYVQSLSGCLKTYPDQKNKDTKFITTRFGNVLGSNGSVVSLFKEQIDKGGPVTVTHPSVVRFFMTIPEACRLVLEAGNMGRGGEIFVFDMGESVKILDLAEKMIRLAGLKPYTDIEVKFTGLRAGEKLYEELLTKDEQLQSTYNKKIKIGTGRSYQYEEVVMLFDEFQASVLVEDNEKVVALMKQLIPEFVSANSVYESLDNASVCHDC